MAALEVRPPVCDGAEPRGRSCDQDTEGLIIRAVAGEGRGFRGRRPAPGPGKGRPAGQSIVEGGEIPYQPWAAAKKKENVAKRATVDVGRDLTLPNGQTLFLGSSGTGALYDDREKK